jgi:proteasome lid subunit RPN8/RPN11
VTITSDAAWLLRNECDLDRGTETGGLTYGRVDERGDYYVEALVQAREEYPTRDQVVLDWRGRNLESVLGDWHSHPSPTPPSQQDRESWQSTVDELGQHWLGLLVVPRGYADEWNNWRADWSKPQVSAWIYEPGRMPQAAPVIYEREGF